MSTAPAVTNNSVLIWSEMESLTHASNHALKKGDVMTALRNVLAILTLLNGVSTTRETENVDQQSRNVELLQQVQKWVEEEHLTAEEVVDRLAKLKGEDFLSKYPSIDGLLLAAAPVPTGSEEVFNSIDLEQLVALMEEAAASGGPLDLEAWLTGVLGDGHDLAARFEADWEKFLSDEHIDTLEGVNNKSSEARRTEYHKREYEKYLLDMVRHDPQAHALAEAYAAAPDGPEKDAAYKAYSDFIAGQYPNFGNMLPDSMQESFREQALQNAAARLGKWDAHVAGIAEELGTSELEKQFIIEMGKVGDQTSFGFEMTEADIAKARAQVLASLVDDLSPLLQPVLGRRFDPSNPDDVKAAAAYLARVGADPDLQAQSDAAALSNLLKGTVGVDFFGLKEALENDPEGLADQIQNKIDVDTRVSDDQAISLKQLVQERQVLLTLISEIINLNTRMNSLVLQG